MGDLSLLQGIFPTQGSNPGLPHCRQILYQLSHQGSPRILQWVAYPSPADLPNPAIEPRSPASQADSLPAELSGHLSVNSRGKRRINTQIHALAEGAVVLVWGGVPTEQGLEHEDGAAVYPSGLCEFSYLI